MQNQNVLSVKIQYDGIHVDGLFHKYLISLLNRADILDFW